MEGAGRAEGKVPTDKTLPKFRLFNAKTLLQPVNSEGKKKVKNIIPQISDANFVAAKRHRHVERIDDSGLY